MPRFFYAKKEHTCVECKGVIFYNEEVYRVQWGKVPMLFHTACYVPFIEDSYNRAWHNWKVSGVEPRPPKKPMGRPRLYATPEEAKIAHRKQALERYHRLKKEK